MKTTGITRRIDDLGRVVIPKEIRKNLNIKDGESLEINVNGEDEIVLRKHSSMEKINGIFKYGINELAKLLNAEIFVTSLEKFILESNNTENSLIGKKISSFLDNIVDNRETYSKSTSEVVSLTDDVMIKNACEIRPIIPHGDMEGLLVVCFNSNSPENRDIKLVDYMAKLLQNFLE